MPFDAPLYDAADVAPEVPHGLPLVIAFTGFTDAGSAASQVIDHLREAGDLQTVLRFENDVLLDYRARRPIVVFDEDHLSDYRPPRLELSLGRDTLGQRFLLLSGYEPDFAWEAFASSVTEAAHALGVSGVTWVHAIPMPVPHTRPLGATVSGTRPDLTAAHSVWKPRTQVPATIGHLLEYRFAEAGAKIAGFVLLVPHYLGDAEYPATAIAAFDSITLATGLVFDVESLRQENEAFVAKVAEQIEQSDELGTMLSGLEERYDAYMAGATQATPLIHQGDLPSADELAAELERFLASRPGDDDRRAGPFS